MLLVYVSISFALGILAASNLRLPFEVWTLWLVLPLASLTIFRDKLLRRANFCALAFLLGAMRYTAAIPQLDSNSLAALNERGDHCAADAAGCTGDQRDAMRGHRSLQSRSAS